MGSIGRPGKRGNVSTLNGNKGRRNTCLICNKKISTGPKSEYKGHVVCSNECHTELKYREFCLRLIKDPSKGKLHSNIRSSPMFRLWMERNRGGFKCEECGFYAENPYSNLSILEIHHKNGDRTDNTPENIQLLCPNHHALTKNFRYLGTREE